MQSPEPIAPDRLDRILRGATPEGEREARLAGVVRELRTGTPGASPALRERVLSIPERAPASAGLFWNRMRGRRAALVLAPAALLALLGGLGAYGLTQRGGGDNVTVALERGQAARGRPHYGTAGASGQALDARRTAVGTTPVFGRALVAPPLRGGTRVRDVAALLRLRVSNSDRLSEATSDAMQITRALGGYVAYVDVDTSGKNGRATMTLRVPVGSVQDAIVRLSGLGTIVGQHVQVDDRQVEVDRLARRIAALRVAVARTRAALVRADTPEERARLQVLLERQRGLLSRIARQRGGIVREASFARIDLSVVTGKAPKGAAAGPFARAAGDALHALAVAGAAALFLLILLSPVLVAAALVAVALRSRRRRIEERLLARLGPAAGQAPEAAPGQLG